MHLLLSERRLTPAKVTDDLGPMRVRLDCPEPDHAGRRDRIVRRPVHGARLLLHHPEFSAPRAAVEIVMEGRDVRMRCFLPFEPLGIAEHGALNESDRVRIPRSEIKRLGDREVIELGEESHEVVGDPTARRMASDDLCLNLVITSHLVGGEAPEVKPRRWIWFRDGQMRQAHLIKTLHFHRPEHRTPGRVERLGRLIATTQPVAERGRVFVAPGQHCAVAAIFVVGLPSGERRMRAVAPGERFDDASALAPIDFGGKAVVPS